MRNTRSFFLFSVVTGLLALVACRDDDAGTGGGTGTTSGNGGDPGTTTGSTTTTTVSTSTGAMCGDFVINGLEECDDDLLNDETCVTQGFEGGVISCTTDCELDLSLCADGYVEEAYLKAANAGAGDLFGSALAISGDTVVVGAPDEASNQTAITNGSSASIDNSEAGAGAAYVYFRSAAAWNEQAYLKPANANQTQQFGVSVAVAGDTIVVGASQEASNQTTITNGPTASTNVTATASGAAYVFTRAGVTWTEQAYLKTPNAEMQDRFGGSVAIAGDTIVVGANGEDSNQTTITNGATASSNNSASNAGAAYVFLRTGTSWAQEAYLKAQNAQADDGFGVSVAIAGDTIVVGATGEDSNQSIITNGPTASADNSSSSAGAVYVFARSGTTWTEEAYLKAANSDALDKFGGSVAIAGDTIVVGALSESSNQTTITNGATGSPDNTATEAGAAYVFTRSAGAWTQQAYLKAPNAQADDYFGESVAISGDTIVVGGSGEDSNQTIITNGPTASSNNSADFAGAAYVFTRAGTTWTAQAYLKAANAQPSDYFGEAVAISGGTIVVGAPGEDSNQGTVTNGPGASDLDNAVEAGAAYVFVF